MASASASFTLQFNLHRRLFFSSSSPKYFQTHFSLKPISIGGFSSSLGKFNNPIIHKNNSSSSSRRCRFLKASLSPEESASQTKDEDESPPNELGASDKEVEDEFPFSLQPVMLAYKEAILNGDEKTMSDVEDMIYVVEKEKNELAQKILALSEEITSGKERYIRLQADFDNFRKRSEKEKLTIRSNTQGEVIESLLPMVDNFERAKQHIKLETEQEKSIDASYQGIYKQFVEIMKSLRVSVVPTVGKPFDPLIHEAIAREESQEFEEGIIIQEFRRGFLLEDRLLRPAMVKVSSGRGERQPPSVADKPLHQPASAEVDERQFSEQSTG
ncbi:hypothetical protein ACH5RR_033889 [Cinchona calisaya]|uniref:GrpE protein homolog n=1 Tax=Cinchona calisaya TaxID=153742 RepID=A0ABD2YEQ9_9GENT